MYTMRQGKGRRVKGEEGNREGRGRREPGAGAAGVGAPWRAPAAQARPKGPMEASTQRSSTESGESDVTRSSELNNLVWRPPNSPNSTRGSVGDVVL